MANVTTTSKIPSLARGARPRLEALADALIAQVTQLLNAPITVVDAQDMVVASSDAQLVGRKLDRASIEAQHTSVRVALRPEPHVVEVIVGTPRDGEVISPRLAQALVELTMNHVPRREHGTADERPTLKDRFIHDLLHGLLTDEAAILREARFLGLNLTLPRAVILIDARDYVLAASSALAQTSSDVEIQQRAKFLIDTIVEFFYLPNDTICANIGDGEIVVLKASDTASLVNWVERVETLEALSPSWTNLHALKRAGAALLARLQRDTGTAVSIGLGRYHPGVQGPMRSYQDARAALSLGQRFHGRNHVHCLDGLGMAAFVGVADEQTKIELSTHLLSPLSHTPELLETLTVFFARNCLPSATANHLSIHRNTLSHRLDKIAALTGLDPRQFDDAVQIRLALLLRELQQHS